MPINNNICRDHSGCLADIAHLKEQDGVLWDKMGKMENKMDSIHSKSSQTLIGIILCALALIGNLIYKLVA